MANTPNFYTNPAFCQQSEFYHIQAQQQQQKVLVSPQRNPRQSPVGAQTTHRIVDPTVRNHPNEGCYEQEFYEEVLVDDTGLITQKKIVVVAQDNDGKKYIQNDNKRPPLPARYGTQLSRHESIKSMDVRKHRYEYIPMKEQSPTKKIEQKTDVQHRYEVIQTDVEPARRTKNGCYALVPVEDLPQVINQARYEYIQDTSPRKLNSTYTYGIESQSPQKNGNRYEYIQNEPTIRSNPIATQKLHELLTTPRKQQSPRIRSPDDVARKCISPPSLSPNDKSKGIRKAQQKLNFTLASRQFEVQEKRHTAIVAPICSSPVQSVYSDTTYSKYNDSWSNGRKAPVQATLAVAAIMMLLCGFVTTGLCLYMISILGRLYYLDFSIVAGFTCLILGLLGFRTRNCYWLPNRNYISGKMIFMPSTNLNINVFFIL